MSEDIEVKEEIKDDKPKRSRKSSNSEDKLQKKILELEAKIEKQDKEIEDQKNEKKNDYKVKQNFIENHRSQFKNGAIEEIKKVARDNKEKTIIQTTYPNGVVKNRLGSITKDGRRLGGGK